MRSMYLCTYLFDILGKLIMIHDDDEVIIRAVSRQILTGTKAKPGLRFADLPKGHLISTETAIRRLGFKCKMYIFSYLALRI